MSTKSVRVFRYNKGLPSIKSRDTLITWSSDFDFCYMISRFKTQTHKWSPTCYYFPIN